jgi:hypothetical protein
MGSDPIHDDRGSTGHSQKEVLPVRHNSSTDRALRPSPGRRPTAEDHDGASICASDALAFRSLNSGENFLIK